MLSESKKDVTENETQRGERKGEGFPVWTHVKSHIVPQGRANQTYSVGAESLGRPLYHICHISLLG